MKSLLKKHGMLSMDELLKINGGYGGSSGGSSRGYSGSSSGSGGGSSSRGGSSSCSGGGYVSVGYSSSSGSSSNHFTYSSSSGGGRSGSIFLDYSKISSGCHGFSGKNVVIASISENKELKKSLL